MVWHRSSKNCNLIKSYQVLSQNSKYTKSIITIIITARSYHHHWNPHFAFFYDGKHRLNLQDDDEEEEDPKEWSTSMSMIIIVINIIMNHDHHDHHDHHGHHYHHDHKHHHDHHVDGEPEGLSISTLPV